MLVGHGNHMIDSDMGDNPKSPNYKGEDDGIKPMIEEYWWDADNKEWNLDKKEEVNFDVSADELKMYIREQYKDSFDENGITVIKNEAGYVIINYWIQDEEVEKYEMYYE